MKPTYHPSLVTLVLAMCLALLSPAVYAAEVADVPTGHWAYEAVSQLVEKGYIHVGEDQLFRGNEPADRYTLATVVAKIIAEIESGRVSTTPEDVRTLRTLVDELRADLVKYYADVQRVEGEVDGAYQKLTSYDERLMLTIAELGDLYRRTTDLEALVSANFDQVDARLQSEVSGLRAQIDAMGASLGLDLQSLRGVVDILGEELDKRSYDLSAALQQEVAALSGQLKTEADALLAETVRLGELITQERSARQTAVAELEDRINVTFDQHGMQLAGQATETSMQLSELREAVRALESHFIESVSATDARLVSLEQAIAEARVTLNESSENLFVLGQGLTDAQAKQAALEQRVAETALVTESQFLAIDQAISEVRQQLNAHSEGLVTSEMSVDQLKVELDQLATELSATGESLVRADGQLLSTLEQLRKDLTAHQSSSSEVAARVEQLDRIIQGLQGDLVAQIDSLASENAAMRTEVNNLRQELLMLQSQIGLSEEQVHELTQRVKEDMANQLTLSLVREGELQRSMADLRSEFDSYRQTSEQQLKGASSAQALSIGALVLGIIGLLK